jgi:hypothetical protein
VNRPVSAERRLFGAEAEALEARFGLRVAARLGEGAARLHPDISERLRFAREQALEHARQRQAAVAAAPAAGPVANGSTLVMGGAPGEGIFGTWWMRLGLLLPLVVLVIGLMTIQRVTEVEDAEQLAQLDADLLADSLPPGAYADPGFTEYLRSTGAGGTL